MATTANPLLKPGDEVFVVIPENGQFIRQKGAVFFTGTINQLNWDDAAQNYLYNVTTIDGNRSEWISEVHYNNSGVGRTITKTHNTARSCFRANLDSIFP